MGIHFEHYTNRSLLSQNTVSFQVWVSTRRGCKKKKNERRKKKKKKEEEAAMLAVDIG